MTPSDIVRAWYDPEFRAALDARQQAQLPDHPSGLQELEDEDLDLVAGGGICRFGSQF
jgi:mersacidin/lichenicidin family type 2 lantibiotic